MARRGSRKQTEALVVDSYALTRAIWESVKVLRRWHPSSIAVVVIEQQLTALDRELQALDVATPAPAAGMFEEQR